MSSNKLVRCVHALKALKELKELIDEEEIKKQRRFWVNPFLSKRELHDLEAHLLKDIDWESGEDFKNFCRMTIDQFEEILALIEFKIRKQDTTMRHAISARVRLAITLRYIATGDSFRSIEYLSRVSRKAISMFLPEVLQSLIDVLQSQYMKTPSTEGECHGIAKDFETLWQFPQTLGAIDGKHIRIKAPPKSGSDFYNYKGYFSTVLLAVVDAHCRFLYIDVGGNGRASDVIVYKNCSLYQSLRSGELNVPQDRPLKGQLTKTPFYFIGDDIFRMDRHMLKAYSRSSNLSTSQEIFNYRLSRARMTVEMAFGRLASWFQIFHRPIEVDLETCDTLVKACCILHNYLSRTLILPENPEHSYTQHLPPTMSSLPTQNHESYKFACQMRDNVCKYCVTDGNVPFQWEKIRKQQLQSIP